MRDVDAHPDYFQQDSTAAPRFICLASYAARPLPGNHTHCCLANHRPQPISVKPRKFVTPSQALQDVHNKGPVGFVNFRGQSYCSVAEATLGTLLETLVEGFRIKEGDTYQIPLGGGCHADFKFRNTIIEFHYPRFYPQGRRWGDFTCRKEYLKFRENMCRVGRNRHQRKKLLRSTFEQLMRNYYLRRRALIDQSSFGPATELVVVSAPEEFYYNVVCKFSRKPPPSFESFLKMYEFYHDLIRRLNISVWHTKTAA